MKNFIHPQKISKFVLAKARIPSGYKQKNQSNTHMTNLKSIASAMNRKTFLSKHARRRAYTQALIGMALSLSGCMGVYDGGFECPPGEGVGCKSISEVNQMVNEGELPKKQDALHATTCEQCGSSPLPQSDYEDLHIWYSPWALGAI